MFTIIGGDGREYGPVTADQVRTWIKAGRANLDTQARALGETDWRRLGDFPEFSGLPTPPIMTDRSGLGGSATEASRGARIGAALVNAFFYFLCTIPGSLAMSRALMERYPEIAEGKFPPISEMDFTLVIGGVLWVYAGLGAGILLQALLLTARGQNLGKLLFGLRVVNAMDGSPAGFVRGAFLRFLVPVTLIIVLNLFTAVLGFVFLLVDFCFIFREDGRCLHDLMAGTKVVRK
jgi:uncharacterized RDD family membrane protein YckC